MKVQVTTLSQEMFSERLKWNHHLKSSLKYKHFPSPTAISISNQLQINLSEISMQGICLYNCYPPFLREITRLFPIVTTSTVQRYAVFATFQVLWERFSRRTWEWPQRKINELREPEMKSTKIASPTAVSFSLSPTLNYISFAKSSEAQQSTQTTTYDVEISY